MAENEYNDEYQYADLDSLESDAPQDGEEFNAEQSTEEKQAPKKNIRRNALAVLILALLLMLGYKFFTSFKSDKKVAAETQVPAISMPTQAPPVETPVETAPQTTPAPAVTPTADNSQVLQKLSDLDASDQNLRSDLSSMNSQLTGISANMSQLSAKIDGLNQTISALNQKIEQQSMQIVALTERAKTKKVHRVVVKQAKPSRIFYIQAVIPGRAWLIAANGSTLTVREGTQIPGYGIVQLIDPNQGRVLTSSGRIIRFSQRDS